MPRKKSTASSKRKAKEPVETLSPNEPGAGPIEVSDFDGRLTPSPRFYRTIALTFLGVTMVLLIFVLFFTSGKAFISLDLKPQTVKADTKVTVLEKSLLEDKVSRDQMAGLVLTATVKGEKSFSPAAGTEIPSVATGQVIIYNKTKANQSLVATTRLLSPEKILFRLKNSVTVPAGGQITAEVYADKAGLASEIGPSKFTIPGLSEIKQKDIYAESKTKMTGGTKHLAAVSQVDLQKAEESLLAELRNLGQTQLTDLAKTTSTLYTSGLFTYTKNFAKTDVKVGAVVDTFKMAGEVKVVGVFYNPADLRQLLLSQLQETLSSGQELSNNLTTPVIQIVKSDLSAKTAELQVSQEFLVKVNYSDNLLDKTKLLGQTKDSALEYLKSQPWVDQAEIKTRPAWLNKIPREASRVQIKVTE